MAVGRESFLYSTMHSQPADLRRVLSEEWKAAAAAAHLMADAKRVILAGMGTSYCAAVAGAWMLRDAGADVWPLNSFDLAVYTESFHISSQDVVVILSHSGMKLYSRMLFDTAKNAGAKVIAITGTEATIEGADVVLRTTSREKTSAYTSSHMSAMAAVAQIATELGDLRKTSATSSYRKCLAALPNQLEEILSRSEEIEPFARRSTSRTNYAVGAGPHEASAIEVIIKVREAAFGKVDGMCLEQYLHGPVVSLNAGDGMLLVNCPGKSIDRVNVAAKFFATVGADMLVLGDECSEAGDAQIFKLPHTAESLAPMLSVVPMQLFAYHMATAAGVNPDKARRDTPKYDKAIGDLLGA